MSERSKSLRYARLGLGDTNATEVKNGADKKLKESHGEQQAEG